VRSANRMQCYDRTGADPPLGAWGDRTGDLVGVVGDRAYFVGRRTDMVNVGGNKVHPIEVEQVVRSVLGVAEVRVYGKRSSVLGELIACQVVPATGVDIEELRSAIVRACLGELTPFQRPRLIDFVPEIALADSGKMNRGLAP
jgi:acyl-CoA synthetase (AMP-forming)/AMP-acid ligase II